MLFYLLILFILSLFFLTPSFIYLNQIRNKSNDKKKEILRKWQNKIFIYIFYASILPLLWFLYIVIFNPYSSMGMTVGQSLFCLLTPILFYAQIKDFYIEEFKPRFFNNFLYFFALLAFSLMIGGSIGL